MANKEVEKILSKSPLILDGAMGTMLQRSGLKPGEHPETLCMTHEDIIEGIHKKYVEAGSDVIYTNTFGANRKKLASSGYSTTEIIHKATALAKRAAQGTNAKVALSIGSIGELLKPVGTLPFEEAYDIYKEMVIAGAEAGADLVVFETMADLYEVKAGVLAAKENTELPIFVSMTYEKTGRTFLGCCIESMACTLEGLGVDAIGINCSLGPAEIFPLAERLVQSTTLPVFVKANAGLPDPVSGEYNVSAEAFGIQMKEYANIGIGIMGGCCGTAPDYIQAIIQNVKNISPKKETQVISAVCTPARFVEINGVRVIGENINPTGKKDIQEALLANNMNHIISKAVAQVEAGAEILDINVGMPKIDEVQVMKQVVEAVQSMTDAPIQIDSSNPAAIEAALRICNGKAIVNSVHGTQESMDAILPIVKKYGAAVIGLALDEKGLPKTAEERFAIAERMVKEALRYGIRKEDIFIDCLTLTVSAQQDQVQETLKAIRMVKEKLGLNTVLGVSNISFGIPNRELMTQTFLVQALASGLDLPIINPLVKANMDAIAAFKVLSSEDIGSDAYIKRFSGQAGQTIENRTVSETTTLQEAVMKGLKEDAAQITKELLKDKEALQIVNEILIPALDKVGEDFELQKIFLPQLINAANASSEAFEVIKAHINKAGGNPVSKGKIVLATVKGDVHDIGKNIVRVVLENYGYRVIDLGKDVAPELIVETAIREDVKLIGLSALMTTTLGSMEETIKQLRDAQHDCKVVVGGAVLTPGYAAEIGADYYAADAKMAVDVAKVVLG